MLYVDYINALAAALPMQVTNASSASPFNDGDGSYNNSLPRAIEYAELRMLRDPDLDFLAARQVLGTNQMTAQNNRVFVLPDSTVVLERFAIFTPFGTTYLNGTRNPVSPASADFIDYCYAGAPPGVPQYWAPLYNTDQSDITGYKRIVLAPTPDQAYAVEVYGTARPAPLSASNTQTFISVNLPDLFFAASMIWWSSFQKNYAGQMGTSGENPLMTSSWDGLYEGLKKGAAVEEARKKAQSAQWGVQAPTPVATPRRV